MKLFWTRAAATDRCEIRAYIARDNPAAAIAMDELFKQRAGLLIEHPEMGRKGRQTGTRELVAHRNYILVYDLANDAVRILRVLHAARRWPPGVADEPLIKKLLA